MTAERDLGEAIVGGIPVRWVVAPGPPPGGGTRRVALFLPFLAGDSGRVMPMLERLAAAGFLAVSFDPWQHGARAAESPEHLRDRMLANFRRDMWPVIGQTTLEAMGVLDWVTAHHDVAPDAMVAGGLSMGGDISVALAGADHRITRVAALGSTPDWTRPGMRDLGGSGELIDQGTPGAYGRWLYEQLDPVTHLGHYTHGPAILFEGGQADQHVPMEAAYRFATALADPQPGGREAHQRTGDREPGAPGGGQQPGRRGPLAGLARRELTRGYACPPRAPSRMRASRRSRSARSG